MKMIKKNNNNQYNLTIGEPDVEIKQDDFMKEISRFRRIDAGMLIVTLILVCFGLIMLFSASMSTSFATQNDNTQYYFYRQLIYSMMGLTVGLFIACFVNINFFRKKAFYSIAYVVTTILLGLVILLGTEQMGAQRWLNIGGIGFQPSEIAKFMAVYCLAGYFSEIRGMKKRGALKAKNKGAQFWYDGRVMVVLPAILMGVWFFLIVLQPHLSGAIIFGTICLVIFIAAKIPWRAWISGVLQMIPLLTIALVIAFIAYPIMNNGDSLADFLGERFSHSAERIETFNDEDAVSDDQNYQTRQAEITMGSGGLKGLGLGKGRQKYNYLPQIHNDYIFPAIAEELGFLGTMSMLILFTIQFLIGTKIALKSRSLFASLITWGFSFLLILQVILNVGVSTKVIPATGITLPFFSYGGTSNIIFLVEIGLILCVSKSGQIEKPSFRNSLQPSERSISR